MERHESLPLGVVLERRRIDNPWKEFTWRPVAVIPGATADDPAAPWTVLGEGEDWVHYLTRTLPLRLFPRETEGYKVNLSYDPPRIFVVVRDAEGTDTRHEVQPFLVTACPYEAQDYLDSGEDIVEGVAMPPDVIAFVQAYIDAHHVDEPFQKRKRKRYDHDRVGFGRPSPAAPRGPRDG